MDLSQVSTIQLIAEVAGRHWVVYIISLLVISEFCRYLAHRYVRPLVWLVARTPGQGEVMLRFPKAGVYKLPQLNLEIGAGNVVYAGRLVRVLAFELERSEVDKPTPPAVQPPA